MSVATRRIRAIEPAELVPAVAEGFRHNRLLTYASAIAFQAILALPAFLMFVLGLLGFLQLDELWRDDLAPEVRDRVSGAAFSLIDSTVRNVLGEKQLFWVTAGAAFALWEVSGAVRAVMGALDEIYAQGEPRTLRQTLLPSLALAAGVGACLVGAVAVVRFGPLVTGDVDGAAGVVSVVVRWLTATALLTLAVGLLAHFAPRRTRPLPWVSFGTILVIVAWVGMTVGFAVYVTKVAPYDSIFGHLATFFVGLLYVYACAVVFVGGLQVDAEVRRRVDG